MLNDVGPVIEPQALQRIGAYLGLPLQWPTIEAAADYLLTISEGFGPHTAGQWLALTRPMVRPHVNEAGEQVWVPHYDPAIAVPFRSITPEMAAAGEVQLWRAYDAIRCPTLLLRGARSDLLTQATALAMTRRGPMAELREFEGVGHAPMLVQPEQVAAVREFLLRG